MYTPNDPERSVSPHDQFKLKRAGLVVLLCSWACFVLSAGFLAGYSIALDGVDPTRFLKAAVILVLIAVALRLLGPPRRSPDP